MGRQIILALSAAALLFGSCARQKMHSATAGPLAGFEKGQDAARTNVSFFPLESVRLTESAFKRAQEMDRCYLMSLDPDRLLAPYLKEAGLEPKAGNYPNWESTGLDGHIGGHYLSALSFLYASTGNAEVGRRLDYMLSELKRCQDAAGNGYLSGIPGGRKLFEELSAGSIRPGKHDLNGKWVPLYNIHKIYAGLRDAYLHTGRRDALDMLIALTDWMIGITEKLDDSQMQKMLICEHGGLNEVFADVAAITGDDRYLRLARRFSDTSVLNPLAERRDVLTGMHANTQIPKIIGFKRISEIAGDKQCADAAQFFWETVVENRSVTIGGNSVREHFHPVDDFSSMLSSEQGPETCNTYNMLRLTKMLYATDPGNPAYMDYYEQALYNHILSSQNAVQGGFVYFTPMRPGHYRVYSQPQTSFWCCVGSGMENHAKYGEMIYAHSGDSLYVNLFIPSTLNWDKAEIIQLNRFPEEAKTRLAVRPRKENERFSILLRCPSWAIRDRMRLDVNGRPMPIEITDGYIRVLRRWRKNDTLTLTLPMNLRAVRMPDGSSDYSFMYGPIVLASKISKERMDGLFADDSRGGHIAAGPKLPLQDMPVLIGDEATLLSHVSKVGDEPLTFRLEGVKPDKYEGIILQPFHTLHECRYMVYWHLYSPDEWEAEMSRIRKEEQERAALEIITADRVVCGEQQPESDHFIEMIDSKSWTDEDRHWRKASGHFCYRLSAKDKDVKKIRVEYLPEKDTDASIWVDGIELGTIAPPSDGFRPKTASIDFGLPNATAGKGTLTLRISPDKMQSTPRIYCVYLLTE